MNNKKTCGIYKITNTLTNETYIGQSKNIEKRIATHKEDLKNGNHSNKGLQEDYDLSKSLNSDYEIFAFEIIKEVKAKDLNKEEMYWINEYNSFERGYNKTSGGKHDETKGHIDYGGGRLFTDEKRIKLIKKELNNEFDNKENYIFQTTSNHFICSECGKEVKDEFEFCPFCGTKKPQAKICPKCKLEPSVEFSFCPKCGTELIEKAAYIEQIERKKKLEERKKIKKELEKRKKISSLKSKGYALLQDEADYENTLKIYNECKEVYNSINQNILNQHYSNRLESESLKKEILEIDESLENINKILEYEKILEKKQLNLNDKEIYELLIDYFKSLYNIFEFYEFFEIYDFNQENKFIKKTFIKWHTFLEKAIEINPNNYVYWREKGHLLDFLEPSVNLRKYKIEDWSIECYKKAFQLNPTDEKTNSYLLYNYKLDPEGFCEGAYEYCNERLKKFPFDVDLNILKLKALEELTNRIINDKEEKKLYEEKLECCDKLLELGVKKIKRYSEDKEIKEIKLKTLCSLKKYEEVIDYCDEVLSMNNYADDETYWEYKINALSELERFEEAIECQNSAVEYLKSLNKKPKENTKGNTYGKITSWELLLRYPNEKLKKYKFIKSKEEELKKYDELLKKEGDNKYYLKKIEVLRELGRDEEAEENYVEYLTVAQVKPKRRVWKTCDKCGHKINFVAKKCPYCDNIFNSSQYKICNKCKHKVDIKFKICPNCYHIFEVKN